MWSNCIQDWFLLNSSLIINLQPQVSIYELHIYSWCTLTLISQWPQFSQSQQHHCKYTGTFDEEYLLVRSCFILNFQPCNVHITCFYKNQFIFLRQYSKKLLVLKTSQRKTWPTFWLTIRWLLMIKAWSQCDTCDNWIIIHQ